MVVIGYLTSANPANANTTPENPMTGPRPNAARRTPASRTAAGNATSARTNGFVVALVNDWDPRFVGKCPYAYSAMPPNRSVPMRFPTRCPGPTCANDANATPVG